MRYEGNIYRPPSEAKSYLLQVTTGCSHNQCTFCSMYKDKKYRVRNLNDLKIDIKMAKDHYGDVSKVFLCDGDAIAVETNMLLDILNELHAAFPSLRQVSCYAGPKSTLDKGISDLTILRAAGLNKVYLGVETGDNRLLKEIRKGVNATEMLQAGQNLLNAGIFLSTMILVGLAGKGPHSREHAIATAEIINMMKPQQLAALTLTPVPNTFIYKQVQEGKFQVLDSFETLEEMKCLIENITIDNLSFASNHASNYLPLKGKLQKDKQQMLELINNVLLTRDNSYLRSENMRGL